MIYIIGLGSRAIESLPAVEIKRIENCAMLVGSRRHLNLFTNFSGLTIELGSLSGALKAVQDFRLKKPRASIVILATGDPGLFGIGDYLCKALGKRNISIIPNVSIVQEAFSKIKESWNAVKVISAHGAKSGEKRDVNTVILEVMSHQKTAIFTDPKNTPDLIAGALIARGAKGYKGIVFETLGTRDEKITKGSLKTIAANKSFNPMNLFVIIAPEGRDIKPKSRPLFGLETTEYLHTNGLITKAEVRAITLAKLALVPALTLWDIGAGSGSVSIEASRLIGNGTVYAVEQKPTRVANITKNRERFNIMNMEIISGVAPEALKGLPDPDRVFIGGGGKGIQAILAQVSLRLKRAGIVVVNAISIDTLSAATGFFKDNGWSYEVVSINISRSRDVGPYKIMSGENPVSIITAKKS